MRDYAIGRQENLDKKYKDYEYKYENSILYICKDGEYFYNKFVSAEELRNKNIEYFLDETIKYKEEEIARYTPHPSHKMSEWQTEIRCPMETSRFYAVRYCLNCESEQMEHPAGKFIDDELLEPCYFVGM